MRRLLGRSARDEAWRTVATRENGEVVAGKNSLKQVRFPHRAWTVILDQYTVSTGKSSTTYTRMRVIVPARRDFRFGLRRENFMTRIGKFFGMRDVETANPLLDRDYLVRTNDEAMIRSLIASSRIPELLTQQPSGTLELAKFRGRWRNRPENVSELRWVTASVLTDPYRLTLLVQVFRETLDRLSRIGAIEETAANYDL
jgi:hypothetical protein